MAKTGTRGLTAEAHPRDLSHGYGTPLSTLSTLPRAIALYATALAVALLVAAWRLRDLAGDAPFALWLPFSKPLFSAAFEASLVLGVPLAWLAAWSALPPPRGVLERPLFTRPLLALGLALATLSAGGAALTDITSQAPGKLAQTLIDTGRSACDSEATRRVIVPIVRVVWECPPTADATLTGDAPALGGASFRARSLHVSPDLRQLELADATVQLPRKPGRIEARVRAGVARIRGLPPWGRPRHVSLPLRLAASLLGALATTAACAWLLRATPRAILAVPLAAAGGIGLLIAQHTLDRLATGTAAYFLLAPLGALTACAIVLLVHATRRAVQRLRALRQPAQPP